MGIWDPINEQLAELKSKTSSKFQEYKAKAVEKTKSVKENSKNKVLEGRENLREQYRQSKSDIKVKWRENRPEWMNYWEVVCTHRAKFILDTPLASRITGLVLASGLTFLLTRGTIRRFKKTFYFGVIGGLIVVPEVMNPFNKK